MSLQRQHGCIFVLFDGLGLVGERLEQIASSDPPTMWILSEFVLYPRPMREQLQR